MIGCCCYAAVPLAYATGALNQFTILDLEHTRHPRGAVDTCVQQYQRPVGHFIPYGRKHSLMQRGLEVGESVIQD